MNQVINYIIDFLVGFPLSQPGLVFYGAMKDAPANTKIVIIPVVPELEITALPSVPLKIIENVPFLYGETIIEKKDGKLIVYADIIASVFFLLSRYEEILKPECRDQYGRFLAKDSVVFQQGYGNKPLVDEYGVLLRKWLREAGVNVPAEICGFSKIYLTHDIDEPFRFENLSVVFKQCIKNMLHYHYSPNSLKKYFNERADDYYTFQKIIEYDKMLKEALPSIPVEGIYFFITAGSLLNRKYYKFFSQKINRLVGTLKSTGAKLGLHLSHEAGVNPKRIQYEAERLKNKLGVDTLMSRHHYLRWREPEDVLYMELAGITDDFTLTYADCAGFRVGTCRPYRFINPRTKMLTNVIIHPTEIMEGTLNGTNYMNLDYDSALDYCKRLIEQVYKHSGELVLLWHNTEFLGQNYQEKLYKAVMEYITELAA